MNIALKKIFVKLFKHTANRPLDSGIKSVYNQHTKFYNYII